MTPPADGAPAVPAGGGRVSVGTDGVPPQEEPSGNPEANSPTSSAVERQTPQVMAAASANARATLRRTQLNRTRTAVAGSLLTADGPVATKYRSRSLVIVYYDSYVQSFFEEVVKFVSASRNLMRKAKMAAKVAQIKRMAELEMPDDESDADNGIGSGNGDARLVSPQLSPSASRPDGAVDGSTATNGEKDSDQPAAKAQPENDGINGILTPTTSSKRLSYTRANGNVKGSADGKDLSTPSPKVTSSFQPSMSWSSSFSPHGAGRDPQQPPDVFDELDKASEFVQSMCEHAAHRFLRDGDCADEIVKIKERLTEARGSADKELERLLENDTDGSMRKMLAEGPTRNRTYRPQSMRRDASLVGAAARLKTSFAGGMANGVNGTNGTAAAGAGAGAGSDAKPMDLGGGVVTLEVDEGIADTTMEKEPSKFQYRSTRALGPRPATGS